MSRATSGSLWAGPRGQFTFSTDPIVTFGKELIWNAPTLLLDKCSFKWTNAHLHLFRIKNSSLAQKVTLWIEIKLFTSKLLKWYTLIRSRAIVEYNLSCVQYFITFRLLFTSLCCSCSRNTWLACSFCHFLMEGEAVWQSKVSKN